MCCRGEDLHGRIKIPIPINKEGILRKATRCLRRQRGRNAIKSNEGFFTLTTGWRRHGQWCPIHQPMCFGWGWEAALNPVIHTIKIKLATTGCQSALQPTACRGGPRPRGEGRITSRYTESWRRIVHRVGNGDPFAGEQISQRIPNIIIGDPLDNSHATDNIKAGFPAAVFQGCGGCWRQGCCRGAGWRFSGGVGFCGCLCSSCGGSCRWCRRHRRGCGGCKGAGWRLRWRHR